MNYRDCEHCLYGNHQDKDKPCKWCVPSRDGGTEYEQK
jgi:hypothetical protein